MKAIWIICTNPLVSMPDVRKVEAALQKAKFVVVQEMSSRSDTLKYADLVLPAASWTEKEGTMTNSERRISYLSKVVDAPGEALSDAEIICRFAKTMGFHGFDYTNSSEIFDEHCKLTKGTNIDISGLSYDILRKKGTVQWPFPSHDAEGTSRLFTDHHFYTANGRAQIHACPDANESEKTNEDFPLILTTGRVRDQWHTMTKTGKVNKLKQHIADSFLEIHPRDAAQRQIKEGDLVEISNNRGNVRVKAKVTTDIRHGVVFLPMHWGKILDGDLSRANNLTNNLVDPRSKEPDFKFSAVQVEKYKKPKQKIVIIGAGAGAFGFVKSYRELNTDDEIEIFSKEVFPFYNRVMLPDYINGTQAWEQLIKLKEEDEEAEFNIRFHKGRSIIKIDKEKKTVTCVRGREHSYDVLILGMGSRPAVPKDLPKLKGIFTLRTKVDADNLNSHLQPDAHVVIIGGGLLGLELSVSLRDLNHDVTIVQRSSKLMDRQLDTMGSNLLYEEITDKGVEVIFNDELQSFSGKEKIEGILLKSGRKLACAAVVYAIGTVPNIELAAEAGIECQRGVVVNDHLQTSVPDIYAIGELAEYNKMLFGITAAAEQQAGVLARYLHGDKGSVYSGSLLMNILKIEGVHLSSIGMVDAPDHPDYEEVIFIDKSKRYYKKCIICQDRLVGAVLIGDKTEFAEFRNLIENKIELSDKRLQLLRSGKKAEAVLGKLVCSCNNVGEGNIAQKIQGGCNTLKELCQTTGAGTGCGSCRPEVKAILESHLLKMSTIAV